MELFSHQAEDFVTHSIAEEAVSFRLLSSIIVPRPIAFITTLGKNGVVNAAPFSFFNAVCTHPPLLSVSIERRNGERKDTARNIFDNQEFVINVCSFEMAQTVTLAAGEFPPEVSEVEMTRLSLIPSDVVAPPRIANTRIQLECVLYKSLEIGVHKGDFILGQIVKIHLHKDILDETGHVAISKLNPLGRLSGKSYAQIISYIETF